MSQIRENLRRRLENLIAAARKRKPMREIITRSYANFQHVNNVAGDERYYVVGYSGGAIGTFTSNVGVALSMPLIMPFRARIDRIGVKVVSGAAGTARIGIYNTTSAVNLKPLDLVSDSGDIDTSTTGLKVATVNWVLESNTLYWATLNVSAGSVVMNGMPAAIAYPILGFDNTFSASAANAGGLGWVSTLAYGAYPLTLPAPVIVSPISGMPAVAYRLAV